MSPIPSPWTGSKAVKPQESEIETLDPPKSCCRVAKVGGVELRHAGQVHGTARASEGGTAPASAAGPAQSGHGSGVRMDLTSSKLIENPWKEHEKTT